MNKLFEKFAVNLLKERIKNIHIDIEEQKLKYADIIYNELQLKLDILISYNKKLILILDTKYKEYENKPDTSHIGRLTVYSNSTGIKNCDLIYTGGKETIKNYSYQLYQNIRLHILSLDLQGSNKYEFENKCNTFINSINTLLEPLINEKTSQSGIKTFMKRIGNLLQ